MTIPDICSAPSQALLSFSGAHPSKRCYAMRIRLLAMCCASRPGLLVIVSDAAHDLDSRVVILACAR